MADVTPLKRNVQQEEVTYRASVSEATFQKMGGSVNFINDFQYDSRSFLLNGQYDIVSGAQQGVDLFYVAQFNIEILDVIMFNKIGGSAGTTTLDLHRYTAPGTDAGSIFSTLPSINSDAVDFAYVGTLGYGIGGGTGMTRPVLSTVNLNQGDALRFDIDSKMTGAEDCGLVINFRPR